MWECGAIPDVAPSPQSDAERTRYGVEEGLGVRFVPRPCKARVREEQCPAAIVTALRESGDAQSEPVLIASDGGVQMSSHRQYRLGAWGAAAQCGYGFIRASGHVCGIDQTTFAAELAGAIAVLRAAVTARVAVHLVIDNRSVQKGVAKRLAGAEGHPRFYFGTWAMVYRLAAALRELPLQSQCSWVPNHGKQMEEWRPPPGFMGRGCANSTRRLTVQRQSVLKIGGPESDE